jgi:hypothetical protein
MMFCNGGRTAAFTVSMSGVAQDWAEPVAALSPDSARGGRFSVKKGAKTPAITVYRSEERQARGVGPQAQAKTTPSVTESERRQTSSGLGIRWLSRLF